MGEHTRAVQGDAVLITRVREGDDEACGELRERHGRAALRLAGLLTRGRQEAEAVVAGALAAVFEILRQGGGPSDAFRPFLLTTLRRSVAGHRDAERETFDPDIPFVEEALAGLEGRTVVRAYLSLPERWRAVLWHTAVEGTRPGLVPQLFGIGSDGVTALAHRAREGLRQAYLQLHLAEALPPECRPILDRIRAYLRGDLTDRETARVRSHLRGCARCRTAVADLKDVGGRLPDVAALVLGTEASAYLVPRGVGLPFRWAGAALSAWWWRSSPGRRKRMATAGAVAAVLTAGLLVWPTGDPLPPVRRGETPVAAEPEPERPARSPSRRAQTDQADETEHMIRTLSSKPESSGPLRPVESRALPVLKAGVQPVGALVPGRTGIVALTVRNEGTARSGEVVADVSLPRGVAWHDGSSGAVDGGWSCRPVESALRCARPPLPPGGGASAHLPVAVAPDAGRGASPSVVLPGSSVRGRASAGVGASGLPARFAVDGRVRVTMAGNVLLSCPGHEPECGHARQRGGARLDNDQWEMGPLDLDGADDTGASSPALLETPGRVRWAGLYWSGMTEPEEGKTDPRKYTARLRGPSGRYRTVEASWAERVSLPEHQAYQAFAEVTEQVRRAAREGGRWWVADVPALTGPGAYAGWSLVVVSDDPEAEPGRTVVLDGARVLGTGGTTRLRVPLSGLPSGAPARIGLLAWEGDAARAGDTVLLDGRPLSSPNAFTGTSAKGERASSFGMDMVSYRAEPAEKPVLEVVSMTDALMVGVVTITAPSRR